MAFTYRSGALCAEQVPLEELARRFGTPCFVYSAGAIEAAYREFAAALQGRPALVCYSVKANSNLAVLALLARLGAGFDIVSGGELARVLAAGGDARKTLFSGVGKSAAEIELALEKGVACLNVESAAELERVDAIARRRGQRAPIALRVNPDIDPRTHPYISTGLRESKFGVAYAEAEALYARAAQMAGIEIVGIGCHIGSQLTHAAPFAEAAQRIAALADRLERSGIRLRHIDLGGGFGIRYRDETPQPIAAFLDGALGVLAGRRETLIVDPGRSIVGNAGVLLTRVEHVKPGAARNFIVVDAAVNDLLRPALYGARHVIEPLIQRAGSLTPADVVGPVCESSDRFAAAVPLPPLEPGDLVAIRDVGAYGAAMSSRYNGRGRLAEVVLERGELRLARAAEVQGVGSEPESRLD